MSAFSPALANSGRQRSAPTTVSRFGAKKAPISEATRHALARAPDTVARFDVTAIPLDTSISERLIVDGNTLDAHRLCSYRAELFLSEGDVGLFRPGINLIESIQGNGGIFTQALTRRLAGKADANNDGIIQWPEIGNCVRNEVTARARETGVRQVPNDAVLSVYGDGRVVFLLDDAQDSDFTVTR